MRRHPTVGLALLLFLQMRIPAIGGEVTQRPGQVGNSFAEDVKTLVRVAIQKLGDEEKIIAMLGKPLAVSSEDIPNKHEPSQIDKIKTFHYDGLVIRVYDVVSLGKKMLLSVRMTKNRPEVLPVLIGVSEKTIEAKYSTPKHVEGTILEYVLPDDDIGQDMVHFEFADSVTVAVEWNYYVD